ncbi:MAG: cobalamin-binding protein, partial [Chloroflexi bacterium]|nr:cobalamin-binding protein [Chloroflexota bacterium]
MANNPELRILSLLASATEIVCALGFRDQLVGRSHECDYPKGIEKLPSTTVPKIDVGASSREIDDQIKSVLRDADPIDALGVYGVRVDVLRDLNPTHIVTQTQCEVCAVSLRDVEAAVSKVADVEPKIVSL